MKNRFIPEFDKVRFEIPRRSMIEERNERCSSPRVNIEPIKNQLSQFVNVVRRDQFGIGKFFREDLGDSHFIGGDERIGRDHRSIDVIHTSVLSSNRDFNQLIRLSRHSLRPMELPTMPIQLHISSREDLTPIHFLINSNNFHVSSIRFQQASFTALSSC